MVVDDFKVIIEAQIDNKNLDVAGSSFGKAAKKYIESAKVGTTKGGGFAASLKSFTAKKTEGGGALSKGLLGLAAKLGIIGVLLGIVVNVLKSLSPIVAILKMVLAVLQIALYPIANFLLVILKPIIFLLLKYVILPFYKFVTTFDFNKLLKDIGQWQADILLGVGKWLKEKWDEIGGWLLDSVTNTGKWLYDAMVNTGTWLYHAMVKTGILLLDSLTNTGGWLLEKFNSILTSIKNISWSDITSGFTTVFDSITSGLTAFVNDAINLVNKLPGVNIKKVSSSSNSNYTTPTTGKNYVAPLMGGTYAESIKSSGGYGDSWNRAYADGGIASTPQLASIAEKGPEAILPLSLLEKMSGGGTTNITFNNTKVESKQDIDDIVDKIQKILFSNSKRTGAF